jgi:hypothetical protein
VRNPKRENPDAVIQDKSRGIFKERLWLKKGCFANDEDDEWIITGLL